MLRYVCNTCGREADYTLPKGWTTLPATTQPPAENQMPKQETYHLCDLHDVEEILGGTISGSTKPAVPEE